MVDEDRVKRVRRQKVHIAGNSATKIGAPPAIHDLYYSLMEISWPLFILLVSAVFFAINLIFGLIYSLIPGAIGGMAPHSFWDGVFFSIETLATVGYGNMAPVTTIGHVLAAIEILTGLFFSATMTGLIFSRFARPRESLVFSRVAVLSEYNGRRALVVRVATIRSRPLIDVSAQMSWLEQIDLPNGRNIRRLVELPLERSRNSLMALSWTLVHLIDEDSAFWRAFTGTERFQLTVTVNGLDTLLASQATGACSYLRDDIHVDHDFVDVINIGPGGLEFDLTKLHDTVPAVR